VPEVVAIPLAGAPWRERREWRTGLQPCGGRLLTRRNACATRRSAGRSKRVCTSRWRERGTRLRNKNATLRAAPFATRLAKRALAPRALWGLAQQRALFNAPAAHLRPRFAPFVQRHWRRAFFWAAVAGVGYLTIPQLYYDRFYGCVNVPDPDYGCAADLLSAAALEEENESARVHTSMPADAVYRYSASPGPKQKTSCSFQPFVERQWNHAFVWVQIPSVGNVTVPEDYYDRFYAYVAHEPPDYASACKLLVEAVAADTVAASSAPIEADLGSQPR
jgi:hypothetical protein